MTQLDCSWESLFKPGNSTNYFDISNSKPIEIGSSCFNISNAWWLAEISRLIYHPQFFEKDNIQLGSFNYEIINYIEHKSTSTHVALLKIIQDNPCVAIAFRGSDETEDWNINAQAYQTSFDNNGKVHSGFLKAYASIRDELLNSLANNALPIFITGHSLGAALSVLATSDLKNNLNYDSCYTFGSPRIGDANFIQTINNKNIYRVVNNCDVVTTIPIDFALIKYHHAGESFLLNDNGKLIEGMGEEEIYSYQKNNLSSLKEYAVTKLFSKDFKSLTNELPSFLADHAPINYTIKLSKL
jgi:triacylglycerol lipase